MTLTTPTRPHAPPASAPPAAEPRVHHWTREEFYKMGEAGLFQGQRVELIGGRVIDMSPIGTAHATAVELSRRVLERAFGKDYHARTQQPIHTPDGSAPRPDVAIVEGDTRRYRSAHPTTAALLVEVAEATLAYDRGEKASLYASAGIADYWVVNLFGRQVEVYRGPLPDAAQPYGWRYGAPLVLPEGESVAPLAASMAAVSVADLLP